jgi:hypothetical protein
MRLRVSLSGFAQAGASLSLVLATENTKTVQRPLSPFDFSTDAQRVLYDAGRVRREPPHRTRPRSRPIPGPIPGSVGHPTAPRRRGATPRGTHASASAHPRTRSNCSYSARAAPPSQLGGRELSGRKSPQLG